MINGQSVLALVTARGGSKGVQGKNLREVAGRSLLARAIDAARQAETVDRVVLSSEDPEIIAAAIAGGCDVPFVRPAGLARDDIAYIATTGEAESLDFTTGHFYSMTTHARGGIYMEPSARAILDVGAFHRGVLGPHGQART